MSMEKSALFVQGSMRRYYSRCRVREIPSIERREFAFFLFDAESMHRGISFRTAADLQAYLMDRVPKHAYFSSAYYDDPTLPMPRRHWLGADLIFDLDADHLKGAGELGYEEMLAAVKERFIHLIEEFILGDMGFDEKDLYIVFSGGRGYHLHVRRGDVRLLGSRERRDIVDHITGRGIDDDIQKGNILKRRAVMRDRYGGTVYGYYLPDGRSGWRGRTLACIEELREKVSMMDEEDARTYLKGYITDTKVSPKVLPGLIRFLKGLSEEDIRSGDITRRQDLTHPQARALLHITREKMGVDLAGETDEPVTSDIKRLIRIPGSVHGKSGLVAVPLRLDDLRGFDPLDSAVPPTLSDASVRVCWMKSSRLRVRGEEFAGTQGLHTEMPGYAAFVLTCRGLVSVEGYGD